MTEDTTPPYRNDDQQLADFLEQRFPEPMATALPRVAGHQAAEDPDAAPTPFRIPEYVDPPGPPPDLASSCRIWRVSGGCDMWSRSAARPMCCSSATATK